MITKSGTPDADGFCEYTLTCDECGHEWKTTVSQGNVPAVRLLARIFSGWDGAEDDSDLCPKHFELEA